MTFYQNPQEGDWRTNGRLSGHCVVIIVCDYIYFRRLTRWRNSACNLSIFIPVEAVSPPKNRKIVINIILVVRQSIEKEKLFTDKRQNGAVNGFNKVESKKSQYVK
jgi:hypothetical protein